jgi:hypothetical protein
MATSKLFHFLALATLVLALAGCAGASAPSGGDDRRGGYDKARAWCGVAWMRCD